MGRGFWARLAAAIASLMLCAAAMAQSAGVEVDLPAQLLELSLRQLADAQKLQIVYVRSDLAGIQAPPVRGRLAMNEVLDRLTAGTPVAASFNGTDTIYIKPRVEAGGQRANPMQLAQAQTAGAGASELGAATVTKIEVTGSRLLRASEEGPQELKTYPRDRIDRSGKTSVVDFLNTLPEVSVQTNPDRFSTNAGESAVRLHGFPVGTTATLLNGRRLPVSANFISAFDLTALPLAAIERIEILPSGSSAIYGSDAIAGVVNFITRRDLDGVSVRADAGTADSYSIQTASIAAGKTWGRGSAGLIASYERNSAIFGKDRELIHNADYTRFADRGGIDRRGDLCSPGTVLSSTTANLPGIGARTAGIPDGITGRPAVSSFLAGVENKCSSNDTLAIIPSVERSAVFATARYTLSKKIEAFAEALFSHGNTSAVADQLVFSRTVPAANPFNPFGVAVSVQRLFPIPAGNRDIKNYFRPLVGASGQLWESWDWEAAAWRSQERNRILGYSAPITPAINAALASTDPSTSFNPFAASGWAPDSVLQTMFPTTTARFKLDVNAVDGKVRGQLFSLPAGPVSAVLGGEHLDYTYRTETVVAGTTSVNPTDASRRVDALFTEVRMPLLAGSGSLERLAITAAERYDRYSDFGTASTPQAGIEFRPAHDVLVRGAYAKAFRAPQLNQLYINAAVFSATVTDTTRPGNPVTVVPGTTVGNRDLKPEEGRAHSLGVVITPSAFPGAKVSIDYWRLKEDQRIAFPSISTILNFPDLFPGRVTRDATGAVTAILNTPANFGSLDAEGYDMALAWRFATGIGKLTPSVDWVLTTKYKAALVPGAPLIDRLSKATDNDAWAPRNKATFALDWESGRYSARAAARYIGYYDDYQTVVNTNKLGNFTLWDLNARIDISDFVPRQFFRKAALSASVVNAFDRSPQFANFRGSVPYDPSQADILGRLARVSVSLDW